MHEWLTTYCAWDNDDPGTPAGQVRVTILHYTVEKIVDGVGAAKNGRVDTSDENRQYTLAALEAVPESVMTGWVKDALGTEEVQRIEDGIDAEIAEKNDPTSGGLIPV